jgi:hypothetical protein
MRQKMEWFSPNWVWVLFFAGFIAMHLFGHGSHGGHGGYDERGGGDGDAKPANKDNVQRRSEQGSLHQD